MDRQPTDRLRDIGEHVARIAHELSAPVHLIAGSLANLEQYVDTLVGYVAERERDGDAHRSADPPTVPPTLPYIAAHAPALVKICGEGAHRLTHVIDQLKRFMRAEGAAEPGTRVDLAELVAAAVRFAAQGRLSPPTVASELSGLPPVLADPEALSQVLVNVIGNAFDAVAALSDPRVWISASVETAALEPRDHSTWVEMRIRDNGPGVPAADRETVFEPFFTTKDQGAGLGLGLAIARDIVERQGGALELSSSVGNGAEFIIRLPRAQ
jgi:signal transduction histidine kinase